MVFFLDRIDAAPVSNSDFDTPFLQWLWVLVDTLNEDIRRLQEALNLLSAQAYTSTQIIQMNTAGTLIDGVLLYDSTNNVYVGKQNGALVQFTTTAYP